MNIKSILINLFANQIIGRREFGTAKEIVSTLDSQDMPGIAKREIATERLKSLGYALAGFLINLAIELAYTYLKSKSQENKQ